MTGGTRRRWVDAHVHVRNRPASHGDGQGHDDAGNRTVRSPAQGDASRFGVRFLVIVDEHPIDGVRTIDAMDGDGRSLGTATMETSANVAAMARVTTRIEVPYPSWSAEPC